MQFVMRIARSVDPASRAVIELSTGSTGWFSSSPDTWRMSRSDWSIRVGTNGSGTWNYSPADVIYGHEISPAGIFLFEGSGSSLVLVGNLDVSRYPPQVGDGGSARIVITSAPGVLESYDTRWERIR